MSGCGLCGGPLYRRSCLGVCGVAQPRTQARRRYQGGPSDGLEAAGGRLEWRAEFRDSKGRELAVAVHRAYRVTVGGHSILRWEPGRRWPGL